MQSKSGDDSFIQIFLEKTAPGTVDPVEWKLVSLTKRELTLVLTFAEAIEVAIRLDPDWVKIRLLDTSLYVAEETGQVLEAADEYVVKAVPQFADKAQAEALTFAGTVFGAAMMSTLGTNVIIQMLMGHSMQALWAMFANLQLIAYLPLLNIQLPANILTLFVALIGFMTFDFIPLPDEVLAAMNHREDHLFSSSILELYDFSDSFLPAAGSLVYFILGIPLLIAFAALLRVLFKPIPILHRAATYFYGKVYINMLIRFYLENFLDLAFYCLLNLTRPAFDTLGNTISATFSIVILAALGLLLVFNYPFLIYNMRR